MRMRAVLNLFGALLAFGAAPLPTAAQESPARRLAGIVGVAIDEYGKGVDGGGRITAKIEYEEAVTFLGDASGVAAKLTGPDADRARSLLDSLRAGVAARQPPDALGALHRRFVAALGPDASLELPSRRVDLAAGKRIYDASCASCHGALGEGNGPAARGMVPAPPAIGTMAGAGDVSPAQMYRVVSVGVSGTPMTAWADRLGADERWDVVTYLATLRAEKGATERGRRRHEGGAASPLPLEATSFAWQAERGDDVVAAAIRDEARARGVPVSDRDVADLVAYARALPATADPASIAAANPERVAERVLQLLDASLVDAGAGRTDDAAAKAFDAYVAFEPLETAARASEPGRVVAMETRFADFKGAVAAGNLDLARRTRAAIAEGLPAMVALSAPSGGWAVFAQSFLIILREGFEAIIVIGAVIAFLVKTGNRDKVRLIWVGVALALAASAATAVVLATLLRTLPASREIVEGGTMLVAVLVLFSVSYWLISRVEAARWQQFIREKVSSALSEGGGRALALVGFLAVYREGAETALFYQALFARPGDVAMPLALGLVAGFVALVGIYVAFHRFGMKLPLRPFFTVTSALLYYMAFVFMGKGVRELQEGNVLPITPIEGFPTIELMGIFPSRETLVGQGILVALLVLALVRTFGPGRRTASAATETRTA